MKKLSFIVGILAIPLLIANLVLADGTTGGGTYAGHNGRYVTLMSGTSSMLEITGVAYALHVGSAAENDFGDWAVLIDSPIATANAEYSAYANRVLTPPIVFRTSGTYANDTNYLAAPYGYRYQIGGEDGVRISTAATVYKTTSESGEAFKTYLEWGY